MKLGLIAYATNTGLGYQTKSIYDNMNPTKTLLVDLSRYNEMPLNHDWFPNARYCSGFPKTDDIEWLTDDTHVIVECETPLNYELHDVARRKGVRVVQIYNREFLDYFKNPDWTPPSLLVSPTSWCIDEVKDLRVAPVEQWSMPINPPSQTKTIDHLETFIHIIGRPTFHDRNGTVSFLEAVNLLGDKYKYKVFYQEPKDHRAKEFFAPVKEQLDRFAGLVEVYVDVPDNKTIFESGDVLVLPRRYGGLCLPMLEALSVGIPVIMPDTSPNSDLLPKTWLCEAEYGFRFHAHTDWDIYNINTMSLVQTMKRFDDDNEMRWANRKAIEIARMQSWETQKPIWEKRLWHLSQ